MESDHWLSWLREQRYSAWESFIVPYEGDGKVHRQPLRTFTDELPTLQGSKKWIQQSLELEPAPYLVALPGTAREGVLSDRLIRNARGTWRVSNKLDCADFGNSQVYAAIGAYDVETSPDLSRYIKICGPQKRDIPISPPHYDLPGGFAFESIVDTRSVLFGCSYTVEGSQQGALFRDFPIQRQSRVWGTNIVVTIVEKGSLRVSMIDFAPREPELSLVCRVFVVENQGKEVIHDFAIHHLPFNSRGTWEMIRENGGASLMDKKNGTGVRFYSVGFGDFSEIDLLASEPESVAQRFVLPLSIPEILPGGSASGWSALVPRISGGDPEEDRALEAMLHMDAWTLLNATRKGWLAWSARMKVQSDMPLLDDVVDNLQCLLKNHEGRRGFHLGTTYQRHTHAWVRDNYFMQRGLLAAGRLEEARHNFKGFIECVKNNGVVCGYNVSSGASWIPRASGELCAYLLLMARDIALWSRELEGLEEPWLWEFISFCADAISLNQHGMVGFDGDEIWFWELDQRLFTDKDGHSLRDQIDQFAVLDNCWIVLCALEYAERIALFRKDTEKAAEWKTKKDIIATAMNKRLWNSESGIYSSFLYPDGTRYDHPFTNGMCTPGFFGARELHLGSFKNMAIACGKRLMTNEGIVKGNVDTNIYAGLSPAFYLHALGSVGAYSEGDDYLASLLAATPSTGGVWEYSLVDAPYTGSDKRRGGDSGVLLTVLIDYLIGLRPIWSGFVARPHLPKQCEKLCVKGVRMGSLYLDFDLDLHGTRIALNNQPLVSLPVGSAVIYNEANQTVRITTLEETRTIGW